MQLAEVSGKTPAELIVWHESEADRLSGESDSHRWEAARLIAAELDAGKTQRQLAEEIGKSQAHVSYMKGVFDLYNQGDKDHPFDSYYQEVKRGQPKAEPALKFKNQVPN